MATYRVLGMVPTVATLPGQGSPTAASYAEIVKAVNTHAYFTQDMDAYSNGMCQIDLSIRPISAPLPSSVYAEFGGAEVIHPTLCAAHLDESGEYDAKALLSPSNLTTATSFRGVGGSSSGTPWAWTRVNTENRERDIMVHEWGHAMTVYLRDVTGEYTNFPECGNDAQGNPIPAMHCNFKYGIASDIDPVWLQMFMTGTIPDGTGINATGWAVDTPTQNGLKSLPRYEEMATPWGKLGPLLIPNE